MLCSHSPPPACPDGDHEKCSYVGTHPLWETLHTTKSLYQLTGPGGPHRPVALSSQRASWSGVCHAYTQETLGPRLQQRSKLLPFSVTSGLDYIPGQLRVHKEGRHRAHNVTMTPTQHRGKLRSKGWRHCSASPLASLPSLCSCSAHVQSTPVRV